MLILQLLTQTTFQEAASSEISQLVAQAQQDPAAFASLYDQFVRPVYRYLYSRIGNIQEAEDLTAQTFLSALEFLPRYEDRGHFSAWIFTIARSKLFSHLRASKRDFPTIADPGENGAAEAADLLGTVIHAQQIQRLNTLFRSLDENEQELIRLRYVMELPFTEIGFILGKRTDAVKKQLYRLLARLETQMEIDHVRA